MELSEVSTSELLDELESRETYTYFPLNISGAEDAFDYALETLGSNKILRRMDDDDIIEYMEDFMDKTVVDCRTREVSLFDSHIPNLDFRRDDCVEILEHIVNRDGWDKVYAILEPYKVM